MTQSGVVLFVVILRLSVWMFNWPRKAQCRILSKLYIYGEEFFVTQLGIIKFAQPEGHRLVILDNTCSHLIAGSVSENLKQFIIVRKNKKTVSCHNFFHTFNGKVHFVSPAKFFLSKLTGERCKNVCVLGPHGVVVIQSTKETAHL